MAINPNINPALMIAAPMLQDYFVDDATGLPLSAGVITCYRDNSRTKLKNWFYMTGTAGAYTFLPLANPLTLSAVGTITDPSGNDCIPFYYPFDETDASTAQPYYITAVNSDGQGQWSRQNFPYSGVQKSPNTSGVTQDNYIINNTYWRNIGTLAATGTVDVPYSAVVAPSQHDGYTNGDIRFVKDAGGATDVVSFIPMTVVLDDSATTPETQISWTCTAPLTGQSQKSFQYPLSLHVNTLANVQGATFTFYAQSPGSTQQVTLYLYQFLGTGAIAQPDPVELITFNINNTYTAYPFTFDFLPVVPPADLGPGGDDAWFIQIGMPLDVATTVNHTVPQFYLAATVPGNSFATYDEVNAVISSPRTGDTRISINAFQPFGWVTMNDGSIGSAASSATTTRYTWPLYNLLWNGVGISGAPMVDGMAYGASAIIDFAANRAIFLTKQLGRLIAGVGMPSNGHTTGTTWPLGGFTGNELLTMVTANVADHIHSAPPSSGGTGGFFFLQNAAGGAAQAPTGTGVTTSGATGLMDPNNPSPTPLALQNPVVYQNIFMKL